MSEGLTGSVLVIGDDMRIFLAVVRALGRAGKRVEVAPFGSSPALKSRYISRIHQTPRFDEDPAGWRAAVLNILLRNSFDLVIPCSDPAITFLDSQRERLVHQRLAIPRREAMDCFYDKERTRAVAEALGVPVTPGRRLTIIDSAAGLISAYGLPVVLKPRRTFFAERDRSHEVVEILDNQEQLEKSLEKIDDRSRYLVEGYFEGEGVGVSVLAGGGRIIQAFQHRRLREGRGGVSSFRISEETDPELLDACARFCRHTGHSGVCMFEFRHNPVTRKWILIEINARFWGSMGLPLALGVDFPNMLHELLVEGNTPAMRTYKPGVRSRNFMLDAQNLLKSIRGLSFGTFIPWLGSAADFAIQPLRWLIGTERSDSFVMDDLSPAFGEFSMAMRKVASLVGGHRRSRPERHAASPVPNSAAASRRELL